MEIAERLAILLAVAKRKHLSTVIGSSNVLGFITYIHTDIRIGMITFGNHPVKLWEHIRSQPEVIDFVFDVYNEWRFRAFTDKAEWLEYLEYLSSILSSNRSAMALDEAMRERLPAESTSLSILRNNPWLVMVISLTFTPILQEYSK